MWAFSTLFLAVFAPFLAWAAALLDFSPLVRVPIASMTSSSVMRAYQMSMLPMVANSAMASR